MEEENRNSGRKSYVEVTFRPEQLQSQNSLAGSEAVLDSGPPFKRACSLSDAVVLNKEQGKNMVLLTVWLD